MQTRESVIYYSDDMIGAERIDGFSSFIKVKDDIFLGREPSYLDIKQTVIGDCYFLSALKSIVRRSPGLIHDIIKERKGRIHVRFYYSDETQGTFTEQWYAIDKSIVSHLFNKLGQGHHAPWVYMLEKAYALHRMRDPKFLMKKRNVDKHSQLDSTQNLDFSSILSSGNGDAVFMDILGCQTVWNNLPSPNQSLVLLLKSNAEKLFDIKSFNNSKIISRLFKNNGSLLLYYSSLLMNLSFNKDAFKLFNENAHALAEKIQSGDATQREILKFFKSHFPDLTKEFYNVIKISVYQGIGVKLGEKRYSAEAIETYQAIHEKIQKGELLTLSTKKPFPEDQNSAGLLPGHAYEVLNCYQREGRCYIVISNPWQRISRGYELASDSSKLVPKIHDIGLFHNDNSNSHQYNQVHDIASSNEAYHPSKALNELGTFELELNDCMNFFYAFASTNIDKSIRKYSKIVNDLNGDVSMHQKEIDRIGQGNSEKEINEQLPRHLKHIAIIRTEQNRILKLITDLNQLKENANPKENVKFKK